MRQQRCKSGAQRVGLDALLRFLVAAAVIHFFFVNSFLRSRGKWHFWYKHLHVVMLLLLLLLTHSTHPHNKFSNEQVSIIMHYLDVSPVLFSFLMVCICSKLCDIKAHKHFKRFSIVPFSRSSHSTDSLLVPIKLCTQRNIHANTPKTHSRGRCFFFLCYLWRALFSHPPVKSLANI